MGRDSAHDDWVKANFGVNPAAHDAAPATAPAAPAAGLPAPGADQQTKAFHDAVGKELATIDGHLAFLGEHADAGKSAAVTGGRATLVSAYQAALSKIDPADQEKGKPGIDKTIAAAKGVAAQAGKARQAAEKAYNDWQARQPKFDEATAHVGEMQQWGHPKASPLQPVLDGVKGQVAARAYTEACAAFDKASQQIKPVSDDYAKQKAAQPEYESARQALDPRLATAAACPFKTLEALHTPFVAAVAPIDTAATGKDYVHALKGVTDLAAKVTAFEAKRTDLEAKQKEYTDAKAAAQPQLDQAGAAPGYKAVAAKKQALDAAQAKADQAAGAEDFVGAKKAVGELSAKADEHNKASAAIDAQKAKYEAAAKALEPRFADAAKSTYKSLEPLATAALDGQKAMKDKAAAEDFEGAGTQAADLDGKLESLAKSVKQLDEWKAKLEAGKAELAGPLKAVGNPPHPKLKVDGDEIAKTSQSIDQAAAEEHFDAALVTLDDLKAKLAKYAEAAKRIEDQRVQFEAAMKPLDEAIDKMGQSTNDPMQQAILSLQAEIRKQAEAEDYEGALKQTDLLKRQLADYEEVNKNKGKTYSITVESGPMKGTYQGSLEEIKVIQAQLAKELLAKKVKPLKNRAEYHADYLKSLQANDDEHYIVAWVFRTFVADLNELKAKCAAQQPAIAALEAGLAGDGKGLEALYETATNAVNAAGNSLSTFLEKIDTGGKVILPVLEVVRDGSFAIFAACATPILVGAGVGAGLAGAIGAGSAAAIKELAEQGAKVQGGEDVKLGDALVEVGKKALIDGVGSFLGGKAGKAFEEMIVGKLIVKLGIDNPAIQAKVKEKLVKFVEGQIEKRTKALLEQLAGKSDAKHLTWTEVAEKMAADFAKEKTADKIKEEVMAAMKDQVKAAAGS